MLRLKLALLYIVLGVFATGVANAATLPVDGVYTLDDQVVWSITGAAGTIDAYDPLLEGDIEFLDAICLDGACGGLTQDWILFRVTVTSGSLDDVGFGALFATSLGLGWLDNLGGIAPASGDSTSTPNIPVFSFTALDATSGTVTSAPLFVAYPDGIPWTGGFGDGAANFMMELGGTAVTFMGSVNTLIPEPGTILLLGSGLIGLAAVGRRSRA